MKNERVILVGASGSGKDYLLRKLIEKNLKYSPKLTTRPKRTLEIDGVDYNFITNDTFISLLESNQIKAYQHFIIEGVDWYYSISKENFDNNQVFIMTPHEIKSLSKEDRKECFIVYLDIKEDIRRSRILKRDDNNDSVERRINSDKIDFKDFDEYDLRITDPEFEAGLVYDLMR